MLVIKEQKKIKKKMKVIMIKSSEVISHSRRHKLPPKQMFFSSFFPDFINFNKNETIKISFNIHRPPQL